MKKKESEVRKRWLKVRLNEAELESLKKLQARSTERDLSNYVRRVVLQKPVVVTYRNRSADDFLKEMLQLRNALNSIGNTFNQAEHQLRVLERIPEFRLWIRQNDGLQRQLVNTIEEIRLRIAQFYDQWLQG